MTDKNWILSSNPGLSKCSEISNRVIAVLHAGLVRFLESVQVDEFLEMSSCLKVFRFIVELKLPR